MIDSIQMENENFRPIIGSVPFPLEMKNFPDYDNFPYNLLYMSYANIDGQDQSGTAVYYPDFSTFKKTETEHKMTYYNQYNRDWHVEIVYDPTKVSWEGTKYHQDDYKGQGGGTEWKMAMVHMTMVGLVEGESCMFKVL